MKRSLVARRRKELVWVKHTEGKISLDEDGERSSHRPVKKIRLCKFEEKSTIGFLKP